MAGVIEGMESEKISVEKSAKQLFSNRQSAEDFGGWERGMEEKSDLYARDAFAQESGKGEEMVIMSPDEVVFGGEDFGDAVGEELVGGEIGDPEAALEANSGEVVELRPEIVFTEAVVETVVQIGREEDGDAVEVVKEAAGDGIVVGGIDVGAEGADVDDRGGRGQARAELE